MQGATFSSFINPTFDVFAICPSKNGEPPVGGYPFTESNRSWKTHRNLSVKRFLFLMYGLWQMLHAQL